MIKTLNFEFLTEYNPVLVRLAAEAERFYADSPNTTLVKLRQFGELLADLWYFEGIGHAAPNEMSFQAKIQELSNSELLVNREFHTIFQRLRIIGNRATHEFDGTHSEALHQLKMAHRLAALFHHTISDTTFKTPEFIPPRAPGVDSTQVSNLRRKLEEAQAQALESKKEFEQELAAQKQRLADLVSHKSDSELAATRDRARTVAASLALDSDDRAYLTSAGVSLSEPTSTSDELSSGQLLNDRFKILHPLSEGGMSKIYKAFDEHFNSPCVVKVSNSNAPTLVKRFQREGRIAYRVAAKVPRVVNILAQGEFANSYYLVMAYVEDAKILDLCVGPLAERLDQLLQAAQVLARVHDIGVIHRDIKPSNYLVSGVGELYLTDFGIAKSNTDQVYDSGRLQLDLTSQVSFLGTPPYMSPEQFDSPAGVNEATDVFALGIMLFELISGHRPYSGRAQEVIRQQALAEVQGEPVPTPDSSHDWPENVVKPLIQLCLKATQLKAEKRLQSSHEFVNELKAIISTLKHDKETTTSDSQRLPISSLNSQNSIDATESMISSEPRRYSRKEITEAFGIQFSDASWNQSVKSLNGDFYLFVTLNGFQSPVDPLIDFYMLDECRFQCRIRLPAQGVALRKFGECETIHLFMRELALSNAESQQYSEPYLYFGAANTSLVARDQEFITVQGKLESASCT